MDSEDKRVIEQAFIDGFRTAQDKRAFLHLAGIPFEIDDPAEKLRLMEVRLDDSFVVGSASPGFGSRDLVYHPLPGAMIAGRTRVRLVYVSAARTTELGFAEAVAAGHRHQDLPHVVHGHPHRHDIPLEPDLMRGSSNR